VNSECKWRSFNVMYWGKVIATEIQPFFDIEKKGNVEHSLAGIAKARHFLGYNPKYGFRQGLSIIINSPMTLIYIRAVVCNDD